MNLTLFKASKPEPIACEAKPIAVTAPPRKNHDERERNEAISMLERLNSELTRTNKAIVSAQADKSRLERAIAARKAQLDVLEAPEREAERALEEGLSIDLDDAEILEAAE